jgi:hypothetical protein
LPFWAEAHTNGARWQAGLFGGYARNLGSRHVLTGAGLRPGRQHPRRHPGLSPPRLQFFEAAAGCRSRAHVGRIRNARREGEGTRRPHRLQCPPASDDLLFLLISRRSPRLPGPFFTCPDFSHWVSVSLLDGPISQKLPIGRESEFRGPPEADVIA